MAKRKEISDSDSNLFRNSIGEVAMIKHDRAELKTLKPPPVPLQRYADEQAVIKSITESSFNVTDRSTATGHGEITSRSIRNRERTGSAWDDSD